MEHGSVPAFFLLEKQHFVAPSNPPFHFKFEWTILIKNRFYFLTKQKYMWLWMNLTRSQVTQPRKSNSRILICFASMMIPSHSLNGYSTSHQLIWGSTLFYSIVNKNRLVLSGWVRIVKDLTQLGILFVMSWPFDTADL